MSGPGALSVAAGRSLCRGPALCRPALCVSGPGALCVGARRSFYRAPALSVRVCLEPGALFSAPRPSPAICVGARGLSVSSPALCVGMCVAAGRSPMVPLPALFVSGRRGPAFCVGARRFMSGPSAPSLCRGVALCVGARRSLCRGLALCLARALCVRSRRSVCRPALFGARRSVRRPALFVSGSGASCRGPALFRCVWSSGRSSALPSALRRSVSGPGACVCRGPGLFGWCRSL